MARSLTVATPRQFWLWSLFIALLWVMAIYTVAVGGWMAQRAVKHLTPEAIAIYAVQKPHVLDREAPSHKPAGSQGESPSDSKKITDRMLAAIVLHGSQAWFFKVTGPVEAIAKQEETFTSFVKTIHFDGVDSPPHWELPEGWEERPGNEMRFKTLRFGTPEAPLDLSVSSLPKGEGDDQEYLLANVNRWRGQLSLPEIGAPGLRKQLQEFKLEGATAYLIDISGRTGSGGAASGGTGRAPFASGGGPFSGGSPPERPERPAAPSGAGSAGLTFKPPESWSAGKAGSMRKASFLVQDGEKSAEITIIDLPAAANDTLTNVNRWRGQVKLGEITQEELPKHVREIEVGGVKGQFVELMGPADAQPRLGILGVLAFVDDKAWFIKLSGDAELAEREKENFEAFVRSIKFQKR